MGQADLEYKKFIFGTLFILANNLQTVSDRYLEEITIKQWLLLVMISQYEEHPPTLGQVALLMGSSHQNVKQIAIKLEKKGFIIIEKAQDDQRALHLKLTQRCQAYFQKRDEKDLVFLDKVFSGFNNNELESFAGNVYKLTNNLFEMDNNKKLEEFTWIKNLLS